MIRLRRKDAAGMLAERFPRSRTLQFFVVHGPRSYRAGREM
jgi:hypothetical protein